MNREKAFVDVWDLVIDKVEKSLNIDDTVGMDLCQLYNIILALSQKVQNINTLL